MFELDETAEGKFLQNLKTMLRPDFADECHLACNNVLTATRTLKVQINGSRLFQVLPPLFFSLLYLQHFTYSEFPLKYKNGFWSLLLQGKRVEVKFENKNETQLLT